MGGLKSAELMYREIHDSMKKKKEEKGRNIGDLHMSSTRSHRIKLIIPNYVPLESIQLVPETFFFLILSKSSDIFQVIKLGGPPCIRNDVTLTNIKRFA